MGLLLAARDGLSESGDAPFRAEAGWGCAGWLDPPGGDEGVEHIGLDADMAAEVG